MKSVGCLVAALLAAMGVVSSADPAGASNGLISGACTLDLSATLIGSTLEFHPAADGACATTLADVLASGGIRAVLPSFACEAGLIVGATDNGSGGISLSVEDDTIFDLNGVWYSGASDGATLSVAFSWTNTQGTQVIVGEGNFAFVSGSCAASSWTGEFVFVDPEVS